MVIAYCGGRRVSSRQRAAKTCSIVAVTWTGSETERRHRFIWMPLHGHRRQKTTVPSAADKSVAQRRRAFRHRVSLLPQHWTIEPMPRQQLSGGGEKAPADGAGSTSGRRGHFDVFCRLWPVTIASPPSARIGIVRFRLKLATEVVRLSRSESRASSALRRSLRFRVVPVRVGLNASTISVPKTDLSRR
jgi:hypothetical protein